MFYGQKSPGMGRAIKIVILFFLLTSGVSFSRVYEYQGRCASLDMYYDEFIDCIKKELKSYDDELNKTYRLLYVQDKNKKLKQAERFWILYKEAEGHFLEEEVEGGIGAPIYYAYAVNKTEQRIVELQGHLLLGVCRHKRKDVLAACLKDEWKKYEQKEKRIYARHSHDKLIQQAEESWVKYKNADCDYSFSRGKTKQESNIYYYACLMNRTRDRLVELHTSTFVKDWSIAMDVRK